MNRNHTLGRMLAMMTSSPGNDRSSTAGITSPRTSAAPSAASFIRIDAEPRAAESGFASPALTRVSSKPSDYDTSFSVTMSG